MAFLSIHVRPGLDDRSRRRGNEAGPPGIVMRSTHERLLRSARFGAVEAHDLTDEYRETQVGWIRGWTANEPQLRAVVGDADFEERMQRRHRTLAAIDEGLLMRSLYVATK